MVPPNYISSVEPGQKYGVDVYINNINYEDFFEPILMRQPYGGYQHRYATQ